MEFMIEEARRCRWPNNRWCDILYVTPRALPSAHSNSNRKRNSKIYLEQMDRGRGHGLMEPYTPHHFSRAFFKNPPPPKKKKKKNTLARARCFFFFLFLLKSESLSIAPRNATQRIIFFPDFASTPSTLLHCLIHFLFPYISSCCPRNPTQSCPSLFPPTLLL
jgi:hypothetical protein